jgi:hypothetical protein
MGDKHIRAGVEVVERVDTVGEGTEGRGREDGDAAGLDGADDERLVGSGEVGVDDTETTKGCHVAAMAPSVKVSIGEERTGDRRGTWRMERERSSVEKSM